MLIKATVTTNCEEDKYLRVKVKNMDFWKPESSLLSSVNSIYLSIDDVVIVDYQEDGSSMILGILLTDDQIKANPIDGSPIIFQSRKGGRYIVGTLTSEVLTFTTDDGTKLYFKNNEFSVITKDGLELTSKDKKLSIKNGQASLFKVLNDLLEKLATTAPTTQGSPAAQNFNPQIIAQIQQAKTDINNLLQ